MWRDGQCIHLCLLLVIKSVMWVLPHGGLISWIYEWLTEKTSSFVLIPYLWLVSSAFLMCVSIRSTSQSCDLPQLTTNNSSIKSQKKNVRSFPSHGRLFLLNLDKSPAWVILSDLLSNKMLCPYKEKPSKWRIFIGSKCVRGRQRWLTADVFTTSC